MTREQNATETTISKQRRAQIAAKARGECVQCFGPRGDDGTKWHCRACADKHNRQTKKYRDKFIDTARQ